MISHEYRCIYVHVPRTAGTSIERWLCGWDWWRIEPSTKHLIASQARRTYAEYWDEYFTFAIVRDPWARMVSCLRFAEYFGLSTKPQPDGSGEAIDVTGYIERFGAPVTLEYDHRFASRDELLRPVHQANAVYGNMLDEELDFVGRYEDLPEVVALLRDQLSVPTPFPLDDRLVSTPSQRDHRTLYTDYGWEQVSRLYARDLERFGYWG